MQRLVLRRLGELPGRAVIGQSTFGAGASASSDRTIVVLGAGASSLVPVAFGPALIRW